MNPTEMKYYGVYACQVLFKSRPQDIIRVYVEEARVRELGPLLKWCAKNKKAYHIIPEAELNKVTESIHHEGVCVLALERRPVTFKLLLDALPPMKEPSCLLFLDGVQNPHNLGAIMRVCAHFGIRYILGEQSVMPRLSASTYRMAQGGAEFVDLVPIDNVQQAIARLKQKGYDIVATSSHKGKDLYQATFPHRTLLVLGAETQGVGTGLLKQAKEAIMIPGTGQVESLNVSVAAALCIGEYWRQTHQAH